MARNNSRASATRRLHRSLGAVAAIFIIFMVMSGLALNHSHGLGLDQRHVAQSSLLQWYGLNAPPGIRSFMAADDWLSFAGSQLYLNDRHITTLTNGVGAVSNTAMLIVAGDEELLLLDHTGVLIERLPWSPPGGGLIEAIGLYENTTVAVRSANQVWLADAQMLAWEKTEDLSAGTVWSSPVTPPPALQQAITSQYRGDGLSLERVLLDFHSGRIFGSAGVLVYDLLAIVVGFMAVSGLVLWLRRRRNGNGNGSGKN